MDKKAMWYTPLEVTKQKILGFPEVKNQNFYLKLLTGYTGL